MRLLQLAIFLLCCYGHVLLAAPGHTPPQFGYALEGLPTSVQTYQALQQEVPVPLGLINLFVQWPPKPEEGHFPREAAEAVAAHGATLVLTWEPMWLENGKEITVRAEDIANGSWDGYITRFAQEAAAWGKPCILRFAHEMNLARYHWGGPAESYGPASPSRYRLMFRRVVRLLRQAGATNLRIAFCPNVHSVPSLAHAGWNRISAYWPGVHYVDVVGVDGYNWGTTRVASQHGWQSSWIKVRPLFARSLQLLRTLAPAKPLYIFETSCVQNGGDKGDWLTELVEAVQRWQLAGVIWFQAQKEVDWRLQTGLSAPDLERLRRLAPVVTVEKPKAQ